MPRPSPYLGPLSDPTVRHERARIASAAAWGPDSLIRRLVRDRAQLTTEHVLTLKALVEEIEKTPETAESPSMPGSVQHAVEVDWSTSS